MKKARTADELRAVYKRSDFKKLEVKFAAELHAGNTSAGGAIQVSPAGSRRRSAGSEWEKTPESRSEGTFSRTHFRPGFPAIDESTYPSNIKLADVVSRPQLLPRRRWLPS